MTISDIKRKNKAAGRHFFDRDTLAFFKSVVYPTVYGNGYFVTRETNPSGSTKYTVRKAGSDGDINTIGHFHSYDTLESARSMAKSLASGWKKNPRRRSKRRYRKNSGLNYDATTLPKRLWRKKVPHRVLVAHFKAAIKARKAKANKKRSRR